MAFALSETASWNQAACGARVALPCLLLALGGILAGCSTSKEADLPPRAGIFAPDVPAFVNGPMSLLLTNGGSYQARVSASGFSSDPEKVITGLLACHEGLILFAPDADKESEKRMPRAGISFIWNTAEHEGFLLSEALQGWAPLSSKRFPTEVSLPASGPAEKRVGGYRCQIQEKVVTMSEGGGARFQVASATDLGHLPVQIAALDRATNQAIALAKIRRGALPAEDFAPPESFTKYSSPEALVDELAARQHNFRRHYFNPSEIGREVIPTPPPERR